MRQPLTREQKIKIRKGLNLVLIGIILAMVATFIFSIVYVVYAQQEATAKSLTLIYGGGLLSVSLSSIVSIVGYILCVASGEKNFLIAFLFAFLALGISLIYSIVQMASGKELIVIPTIASLFDAIQTIFAILALKNIGRSCHKTNKLNNIMLINYLIVTTCGMIFVILLQTINASPTEHWVEILSTLILVCLFIDPALYLAALIQSERRLKKDLNIVKK